MFRGRIVVYELRAPLLFAPSITSKILLNMFSLCFVELTARMKAVISSTQRHSAVYGLAAAGVVAVAVVEIVADAGVVAVDDVAAADASEVVGVVASAGFAENGVAGRGGTNDSACACVPWDSDDLEAQHTAAALTETRR
jgi:hypothetical protein